MLTTIERDELIRHGSRLRATNLVAQVGYTLRVAKRDGDALVALLPPGYLGEMREATAAVEAARGDKTNRAAESKDATRRQAAALREAKVWRRRATNRGNASRWLGNQVPQTLTQVTPAKAVPAIVAQMVDMDAALDANAEVMGGERAASLREDGARLREDLASEDAEQESKRLAALPASVRDFYAAKGALYAGLKVVNYTGRELHAADPRAGAAYHLKILHRRARRRAAKQPSPLAGQ